MFEQEMAKLVDSVDGALSCVVMGFDGISLERYPMEPVNGVDVETVGMEYSVVMSQIKTTTELMEAGQVGEVAIRNDSLLALFRVLTEDYFLVLAMKPTGNFGKGRYMMRMVSPNIEKELI